MKIPVAEPIAEPIAESVAEPGTPAASATSTTVPFVVSLGVHVLLLLGLASIVRVTFVDQTLVLQSEIEEQDEIALEDFELDAKHFEDVGNEGDANLISESMAIATHVGPESPREIEQPLDKDVLVIDVLPTEELPEPNETDLLEKVDTTGTTEHPGGVDGAIDRIAFEIAASLRENKTLVIWLFDASLSLKSRRVAIADRFENIYRQLEDQKVGANGDLVTAVSAFGESTSFLTEAPVEDVASVAKVVRKLSPDVSGKENVFRAVAEVTEKWKSYRTKERRSVMIVVVTDERGDDFEYVERAIELVRKRGIRVFCIGNAAVFGREKGYVNFTDAKGTRWDNRPVDQGPETVRAERLQLPFWGAKAGGLERMSATYGPYALTRLCTESDGLYLVADENRGPRFDPEVMRDYPPDYRPIARYERDLESNLAKGALIRAAQINRATKVPTPRVRFRADTDANLRKGMVDAQKPFAEFDHHLKEIHQSLERGEKDREQLDTPRWRASYDLAMGRILAMRVRAYGYNLALAEMKTTPPKFERDASNMWRIAPTAEMDAPPMIRRMAKQSQEYLDRVIDEHAGTPWAMLAQRELSEPMGWAWKEGKMYIAPPASSKSRKQLEFEEEEKKRERNKPKRDPGPPPNL